MSGTSEAPGGTMKESRAMPRQRTFRFTRRYLLPRLWETILHKNAALSVLFSGALTFLAFRFAWVPALQKVAVKDLVAGMLAFSALGFGAATAATVLALGIPRGQLYYTMITNGPGAPRARITKTDTGWQAEAVDPDEEPLLESKLYGQRFRSFYGDLIFTFVWTLGAQLGLGVVSLLYFAIAGDLNMVDCSNCRRSSLGLFIMASATIYAILQMGSLLRAMADYALNQEIYDRREIGL
ncbi:hypothetical protein O7626_39240 [Micromonospora sp. WMMD1102]|uniref:hypothetical protein n=1 Tax=Micromonospora sp. WMMD1102 TaxID=3016105 RepID=UPI0024156C4D|nr:hypothetical protein [Micromonospora sp. WMMD1102]MDG4791851.1 hypothetical protein [Micromonospora sp. WMMD1102]